MRCCVVDQLATNADIVNSRRGSFFIMLIVSPFDDRLLIG
jgi:hypothetical protein